METNDRQPGKEPELTEADIWRIQREESMRRRARNRGCSLAMVRAAGIPVEVKNQGAHLIVTGPRGKIDFWPGTGKWICRLDGKTGRGVRNLLNRLKARGGQDDVQA